MRPADSVRRTFRRAFALGLLLVAGAPAPVASQFEPELMAELDRDDVHDLEFLVAEANAGRYFGARPKEGDGVEAILPFRTQRSTILHFCRNYTGDSLKYKALAMGTPANGATIFDVKHIFHDNWQRRNMWRHNKPYVYRRLAHVYFPLFWSERNKKISSGQVNDEGLYRYRMLHPDGTPEEDLPWGGGEQIMWDPSMWYFTRGNQFKTLATRLSKQSPPRRWQLVEHKPPFLVHGRLTHVRVLLLAVVQPSGERRFYMHNRMRLWLAPMEYNEKVLMEPPRNEREVMDQRSMLESLGSLYDWVANATNSTWSQKDMHIDFKEAVTAAGHNPREVMNRLRAMSSLMFSITGPMLRCRVTLTSLLDDACFQMLEVDVGLDRDIKPFFIKVQ
ncbi:unnamed protein product [Discosporangium mesarthrocarpum]